MSGKGEGIRVMTEQAGLNGIYDYEKGKHWD